MTSKKIFIINGPNLNLLGDREPDIYGNKTLEDLENDLNQIVEDNELDISLVFMQSNSEGEIVDQVQMAGKEAAGLIINAGGLSHTSVSILDSLLSINIPKIEVHISNLFSREEFMVVFTKSSFNPKISSIYYIIKYFEYFSIFYYI